MAAKTTGPAYEIILTEIETSFLVRAMFPKYAQCVFRIIRAKELGDYRPAVAAHDEAYGELRKALAFDDIADQILEYHLKAEE